MGGSPGALRDWLAGPPSLYPWGLGGIRTSRTVQARSLLVFQDQDLLCFKKIACIICNSFLP